MPSLTHPSTQDQSNSQSSPPPQLPPLASVGRAGNGPATYPNPTPPSPVAPEYSPITPRALPALPATYPPPNRLAPEGVVNDGAVRTDAIAPTAQYIPEPAPQPFSSEDATDAIALRAAISSLQFQKKKAQDDIKELERVRKQALDDPKLFKTELAAGRLKEQRPKIGDLQAILDHEGSDDDDEEVVFGESVEGNGDAQEMTAEVPDSQPSRPTTSSSSKPGPTQKVDPAPFGRIPGPQNVVRMPYVNWDKYHIAGDALNSVHEQQRKWPGNFAYGQDRGREQVVAAPYSPWLDSLDGQQRPEGERRSDSVTTPGTAVTPTTTVSEHPMETRKRTNQ